MSKEPLKFLPAQQGPPLTSADRVAELEKLLNDQDLKHHHEDFRCLIKLYTQNEISPDHPETIYIQDGKLYRERPFPLKNSATLRENVGKTFYQQMQAPAQYVDTATFSSVGGTMIEICAKIRIPSRWGGNDAVFVPVMVVNDTGSDLQTVFDTPDLAELGFGQSGGSIPNYTSALSWSSVLTATGLEQRTIFEIEMQITDLYNNPVTDWFSENAILTLTQPHLNRLSGSAMRRALYFASPPGNRSLYVAKTEQGIIQQIQSGL